MNYILDDGKLGGMISNLILHFSARMAAALARQTPKAANMAKQVFENPCLSFGI